MAVPSNIQFALTFSTSGRYAPGSSPRLSLEIVELTVRPSVIEFPAESIGITLRKTSISAIIALPSDKLSIFSGSSGFRPANITGSNGPPKPTDVKESVDA